MHDIERAHLLKPGAALRPNPLLEAMAAPDDAGAELVEGEEAGLAAAAVWSLAPAGAGVAGALLVAAALDCCPAGDPG